MTIIQSTEDRSISSELSASHYCLRCLNRDDQQNLLFSVPDRFGYSHENLNRLAFMVYHGAYMLHSYEPYASVYSSFPMQVSNSNVDYIVSQNRVIGQSPS